MDSTQIIRGKSRAQWAAEKIEILEDNLARIEKIAAATAPGLWDEKIAGYRRSIELIREGDFFIPNTYQGEEAHTFALELARK